MGLIVPPVHGKRRVRCCDCCKIAIALIRADPLRSGMLRFANFPTEAAGVPKATKPGWLARLSLVELVRSILFRFANPECQSLFLRNLIAKSQSHLARVHRPAPRVTSPSRGSPVHTAA